MSFKYGTICSKHDKIKDSATYIRKLVSVDPYNAQEVEKALSDIDDLAYLIIDLVDKCF